MLKEAGKTMLALANMSLILFFLNHSLLGKIKINIRTVVFRIFLYIIDLYLVKKE
jgi:hypothetical protein